MPDALIVNASPLIFLGNDVRLELLRSVGARRVLVPQVVFDEVAKTGAGDSRRDPWWKPAGSSGCRRRRFRWPWPSGTSGPASRR
jgi:hypothetical protein